jgi:hypothetical protein
LVFYYGFSIFIFIPIVFFFFLFLYYQYYIIIFSSLFSTPSLFLLLLCWYSLITAPTTHSAPSHLLSSPSPHLSLPFSPNLSPDYPSLLHTHHLLTNLLYQLYTTSKPSNP